MKEYIKNVEAVDLHSAVEGSIEANQRALMSATSKNLVNRKPLTDLVIKLARTAVKPVNEQRKVDGLPPIGTNKALDLMFDESDESVNAYESDYIELGIALRKAIAAQGGDAPAFISADQAKVEARYLAIQHVTAARNARTTQGKLVFSEDTFTATFGNLLAWKDEATETPVNAEA